MPFWQFYRQGRDGRALLVWPSRIPRWISKILFALGFYEFLAMLEAKLERPHFLKVQSGKITVVTLYLLSIGQRLIVFSLNVNLRFPILWGIYWKVFAAWYSCTL